MARLNRNTLLSACEDLLGRDDVTIRLAPVNSDGQTAQYEADYDEDNGRIYNVVITVDQDQGGLIECVLHECLHVVLDHLLNANFNYALEEVMVRALERELFQKAIRKGRLKRWRKLIQAKI